MASTLRKRPRSPLAEPWGRMRVLNQIFRIPARGHFQATSKPRAAQSFHNHNPCAAKKKWRVQITHVYLEVIRIRCPNRPVPTPAVETAAVQSGPHRTMAGSFREFQPPCRAGHCAPTVQGSWPTHAKRKEFRFSVFSPVVLAQGAARTRCRQWQWHAGPHRQRRLRGPEE